MRILILLVALATFVYGENSGLVRLKNLRAKQIEKIDKVYLKELDKLKSQFLKAEDLDAANEVQKEIDDVRSRYVEEPAEPEQLKVTYWNWANGGQLWMRSDGVCKHTYWSGFGKWKRKGDKVIILTYKETEFELTFKTGKFAEMRNLNGGQRSSIQFLREESWPEDKTK